MSEDQERTALINALKRAEDARESSGATILGRPGADYIRIATEAIEASPSFNAVSGHVLYTADSLLVLHAHVLASHLSFRTHTDVPGAVDWLLKVLRTKAASGFLVAAVWGISVSEEIRLSPRAKLIPFDQLRPSYFKKRIEDRAKRYDAIKPWMAHNYWQTPTAAYVHEIADLPYIGRTKEPIDRVDDALKEARELWTLVEMIGAGRPLVFGSWFEYADESLDVSAHEIIMYFSHAEVAPIIDTVVQAQPQTMRAQLSAFNALPDRYRNRLLRSANRYCLSQCRQQVIDRVLDLALAYEIALTGSQETNAAISWKISVRAAQLIGGPIGDRVARRNEINDFYQLRSKATHGSELKGNEEANVKRATDDFKRLFLGLVKLGREPVWQEIELESLG